MLTIDMLPGDYGDALWIEYGDPGEPRRMLVDGGAPKTGDILRARINALPVEERKFELVVVTHIDLDHISGILELLEEDTPEGLEIGDFWFNGYPVLPDPEGVLGAKQGERLSFWLGQHGITTNAAFGGGAVMLDDDFDSVPTVGYDGDLAITLLSPTRRRLLRLRAEWEKVIRGLELEPGEAGGILAGHPEEPVTGVLGDIDVDLLAGLTFKEDTSRPNASSIAFLLKHDGTKVLFTGDCFSGDLEAAIRVHLAETGEDVLRVDAWKLSHHGGKKNTGPDLCKLIACPRFLVPTSGARYHHPNQESLARILVHGAGDEARTFFFNYRSEENEVWDDAGMQDDWNYATVYPEDGEEGVSVVWG